MTLRLKFVLLNTSLFNTLSVTLSPPLAYELLNNAALVSTSLFTVQPLGKRTLTCPESVFRINMPLSCELTVPLTVESVAFSRNLPSHFGPLQDIWPRRLSRPGGILVSLEMK